MENFSDGKQTEDPETFCTNDCWYLHRDSITMHLTESVIYLPLPLPSPPRKPQIFTNCTIYKNLEWGTQEFYKLHKWAISLESRCSKSYILYSYDTVNIRVSTLLCFRSSNILPPWILHPLYATTSWAWLSLSRCANKWLNVGGWQWQRIVLRHTVHAPIIS